MRFHDQVEVVTAKTTNDGYGGVNYDWKTLTVVATVPATVYTVNGGLLEGDGRWKMLTNTRKLLIPPGELKVYNGLHRIRWHGDLYDIVSDSGVISRGRFPHHRELEITRWNV